ncbi:type I secretion system permease/ATPase [Roseovarius sp. MS2]|uniref:type I secretion system permease/ATPase n=1 Tax=Roseovarius sp. MS2 TaxID=3390728 RepID=UPI003EDBB2FB
MAHPHTDKRRVLEAQRLLQQDIRRHGLSIFAISGLINVLALTGSIYMMQVYDRALVSGSVDTLVFLSLLAGGLLAFHGIFDALRARIMSRLGSRLDQRLAPLAHRISIDMPRYGFSATEATERSRTVDTLRGFLSGPAPAALFDLPWMPIFILFVYVLHPTLGLVTLAGAAVLVVLTIIAEIRSRELTQAVHKSFIERNNMAESNARNADVLIAMGAVDRAVGRFERQNAEHLNLQAGTADSTSSMAALSRVLRMMLQSGLLGLGAYFAIKGDLSSGAIMAVSVSAGRALAPVDQVIGNWRGMIAARHAYSQLQESLVSMQVFKEKLELPLPSQTLSVEGITVASPATGRILLSDVSFSLERGQALAVLGPSGGGKSTLIRALSGVWPLVRGSVRMDGNNLSHYNQKQLGQIIGYLPQEVSLFNGTILENISRLSETRDSKAIYIASSSAGVHGLIASMPDGYDTNVGPGGTALSAGQRQRIGLARALYDDPFVVLLDEPNSSLDAAGEKALNETIRIICDRGGIVIVVAHRPNVLAAVDMVAIVNNGRLVAFGPKEEVLNAQATNKVVSMNAASTAMHAKSGAVAPAE